MTSGLKQNWKLATLRAQIFVDLIFEIYYLIKLHVTNKYSIFNENLPDL